VDYRTFPMISIRSPSAEAFTRLARRSAASGAALAQGVADLADQPRQYAEGDARAAGERASALIAGLCKVG
jgi:hypothetical protein